MNQASSNYWNSPPVIPDTSHSKTTDPFTFLLLDRGKSCISFFSGSNRPWTWNLKHENWHGLLSFKGYVIGVEMNTQVITSSRDKKGLVRQREIKPGGLQVDHIPYLLFSGMRIELRSKLKRDIIGVFSLLQQHLRFIAKQFSVFRVAVFLETVKSWWS